MNLIKTLKERFLSDTPDFFKRIDLIGLLLLGLAGFLADNGFSNKAVSVAGAIGAVLCLVAKFAKKDIAVLEASTDPAKTLIENLPEYQEQIREVAQAIKPVLEVVHKRDPIKEAATKTPQSHESNL